MTAFKKGGIFPSSYKPEEFSSKEEETIVPKSSYKSLIKRIKEHKQISNTPVVTNQFAVYPKTK